jgi:transglutaminase-like putative cysteine protease
MMCLLFAALPRRRLAPWLLAFCVFALRLGAMPEYAAGILDLATVQKAAAAVDLARYPNADDVLIDDAIVVEYQADGTSVTVDDTCLKVLTEKGRRENKTLSRNFTLPFGTAAYLLVQVIKPDGSVVPVDLAAQSKIMVNPSQMGSNIYNPDDKVLQVSIPELAVGDLVRYVARHDIVKPRVPDTFSEYEVFEYTSPILHYSYEVNGPKALPLRSVALKGEVPGTVRHTQREEGDRLIQRWEVAEVPRMYDEPRMPPLHTVVQRLLISTIPDWQYLSKWYWKLCEPHLQTTPAMQAKVDELTQGLSEREARLRAVFRFVSQEVRYMGITVEKEAPGYEPHDVTLTFENRHGVCRDKAVLLVAMLRLAGITAHPVLIHNGPKKEPDVPQPFFNHAIAAAENPDGSYVLMDPTDENTKDLFPAYLCNQSYLVARPEGETLLTSAIIPAEKNMVQVETTGRIDARGTLTGSSRLRFDGINDNAYRGYFSSIKPDERRRFFEGIVKRMAAGARLTALAITPEDMMNTEAPLDVTLSFAADDVPVSDGTTLMLPLPRLGASVGMVNFILRDAGLKERKYPFLTEYACGVHETFRIDLDAALGSPVALPVYEPIRTATLSWDLRLAQEGRALVGEGTYAITAVELSPAQYAEMKATLKTLEVYARKRPILQRAAAVEGEADAVVLQSLHEYDLQDATHWTWVEKVQRQILSYKGKKDNGELKWSYNPAWEKVEVIKAAVTAADGTVKEISAQEMNEMDAGWAASAPRYPAGKTLVASLPGVEIGCRIDYEVRHTIAGQPFFAARHVFRSFDRVERKVVRIRTPAGLSLHTGVFQGGIMDPEAVAAIRVSSRQEADGRKVTEWEATDQPAIRREDGLPPLEMFAPTLLASAGDWKAYTHLLAAAAESAVGSSTAVQALARQTVAEAADPAAAVRALRDLLATRIRRAGPALPDLPLAAISAADVTLRDGYGNTTDTAILLYALLRHAGFRPQFVLASALPRLAALEETALQYPAAWQFPEVLVSVKVPGVGLVYLNDTDQYAVLGATPHDQQLALSLSKARPERVQATADRQDFVETTYAIRLEADGSAEVTVSEVSRGGPFGGGNRKFSEMPPEERRRYFEETVSGLSQNALAVGDLVTDFAAYPGTERFTARVTNLAIRDGDFLYLSLPATLNNLLGLRADQRTNPIYWGGPRRFRIVTDITLPPEFTETVLAPAEFFWSAPAEAGSVWVGVRRDGAASLRLIHDVDLKPGILSAADYGDLLEVNRKLSNPAAGTLLLRRTPAPAQPLTP